MKNHIAILTGGPSSERSISEKSANLVAKALDKRKYSYRYIIMNTDAWVDQASGASIDLNDFSLKVSGKKEYFDFVFLMIHGTPAEDGKIQGYFELLNIPHSTCDTLTSALAFNKQFCKDFLEAHGIALAPSITFSKDDKITRSSISQIGFPLFVKPNSNGSSYGISKVKALEALNDAVELAFNYDDEIIVEAHLEGREFGCSVVRAEGDAVVFPVTEIIPDAEFFTYEAKYEGASKEITPAKLSKKRSLNCQNISKKLYELLKCRGMVRFDFILVGDTFFFLEVNTIPGLSAESILPQQAIAHGWTIKHLLNVVIEDCMKA